MVARPDEAAPGTRSAGEQQTAHTRYAAMPEGADLVVPRRLRVHLRTARPGNVRSSLAAWRKWTGGYGFRP
jgi:hypothetical protein